MRLRWKRPKQPRYSSTRTVESKVMPGVRFLVAKMSFGRRLELMTRVRELAARIEFLAAAQDVRQKMEAGLVQAEIERVYVSWGIRAVSGLVVDGQAATPQVLADSGPESLFREALALVQSEVGLTEAERKN